MDFTFSTQLHYLVHFADGEYVAHCLDMDLVGSGKNEEEAVDSLNNAVRSLVYFAIKSKVFEVLSLCKNAPARYWDMFEEAKLRSGIKMRKLQVNPEIAPVTVKECHWS
jgi:hypothetical protein